MVILSGPTAARPGQQLSMTGTGTEMRTHRPPRCRGELLRTPNARVRGPYHVRPYPLAAALNASSGVTGVTSPSCRAVRELARDGSDERGQWPPAGDRSTVCCGCRRVRRAAATVLSSTFGWPDIRWEPTGVVLPAFVAGWPGHRSARTGLQGRQPQ